MIQYHIFPGKTRRIVTFSYDDGPDLDARLIDIFNRYGVKGTFHISGNPQKLLDRAEELRARYEGHEISCHTSSHGWPARMPGASLAEEILSNRRALEEVAGYPVLGMSYPSGSFSDEAVAVHRACGIVYSRTTVATNRFDLPQDFLRWHPTCHQKGAEALVESFMTMLDSEWVSPLFYIWGHAHEMRTNEDWERIERLVAALAGNPKIWYATNIEIYDYLMAQRSLKISADERVFTNPSATDVYVERNKKEILLIPAGTTVRY